MVEASNYVFRQPRFVSTVFKGDEGYSEDTRSQSDNDTAMRADSRMGDVPEVDEKASLKEWITAMNETERSGTSPCLFFFFSYKFCDIGNPYLFTCRIYLFVAADFTYI
jgi:hypothetical protein